jgi:carboxypeptidase Taq
MNSPLSPSRTAYLGLQARFRRVMVLDHILDTLRWDQITYMPSGSASARADQLAQLSALRIEGLADPQVTDLFERAELDDDLNDLEHANLREMRRHCRDALAAPKDLVIAATRASTLCEAKWREAREANAFPIVARALAEVVNLWRQISIAKSEVFGCSPYDALIDSYEPGGRSEQISSMMSDIETWLPNLIDKAIECQKPRPIPLQNAWSTSDQTRFFRCIMAALGFDFGRGRLDQSIHPASLGRGGDVRVTARWDDQSLLFGIKAVLHETGHALYESGVPQESGWAQQPVGLARGSVLHESQALLYEVQLGRSLLFLEWLASKASRHAGVLDESWSAPNLINSFRRISRSLIRIDADELTYPGHVIMRFRLERDLIEGRLSVADLPSAWNELFLRVLGISVPDERSGCLQDIHWYKGTWGYFAVYIPGAIAAAQLYQSAGRGIPDLPERLRCGDFEPLLLWLRQNVHVKASRWTTDEVLSQATGCGLDVTAFRFHLEERYLRGN